MNWPHSLRITSKCDRILFNSKEKAFKTLHFYSHGLVGHRTRDLAQDFKHPFVIAYFNVDYAKNPKGTNYWRNRILKVAKEYSGDYRFAISAKDEFQHELNEYGYDYTGEKPVVLARDKDNQKFIMTSDFSLVF